MLSFKGLFAFAALAILLASCSTTEESYESGRRKKPKRSISSQFEWAVQNYEAGDYAEAIKKFERLRKSGTEVPEYDLIAFYIGMSRFKLQQNNEAARELETFLREGATRQESQDARITLLLDYERLRRWQDLSSLAAETDKLTLFQYNRALLKLVWARALREQGELKGAKAVLQDSSSYLDKVGTDDRAIPYYSDPDLDLWGRYHFTTALLQSMECNSVKPRELSGGKKRRLYGAWLESMTDCFRQAFSNAAQNLFSRESAWAVEGEKALAEGILTYGKAVEAYLREEKPFLNQYRALQKISREQLYRLLTTLDDYLKNIKNRGLSSPPLEQLRKELDHLLVGISSPS